MRVLLTGCTATQVGSTRRPLMVASFVDGIAKACRTFADVDWVRPLRDVDPAGYDLVIAGISAYTGLHARHSAQLLDLVWRAKGAGVPVVLFVDDWHLREVWSAANAWTGVNAAKNICRRVGVGGQLGPEDIAYFRANHLHLIETVRWIMDNAGPRVWLCAFPWGQHEVLANVLGVSANRCRYLDPSSAVQEHVHFTDWAPKHERERLWVLATLFDHSKWLNKLGLLWAVKTFGKRKAGVQIPESAVVKQYATSWGVLSPPYKFAASGWWRNRFNFAAQAGAIIIADPAEIRALGGAYLVSPHDVECLDDGRLQQLALDQRELLVRRVWGEDEFTARVHAEVEYEVGS